MLNRIRALGAAVLTHIRAIWTTEPVRTTTILTTGVMFTAAKAGIVVDEQSIGEALAIALPILLGGEAARQNATPYAGEIGPPSDDLVDLTHAPAP